MLRAVIKSILRIVTLILFRVKVVGKEKIDKDKPLIICPNHISFWDAPILVSAIKRNDMYILAKEELYKNEFIKWVAKKTRVLPVKRGIHDAGMLKVCLKALKENHIVLLFPEGTRNGIVKNGKLHNGAVLMSIMSGAPIIPIGLQTKTHYRLFTKVKINIGNPMDFSDYKDKRSDKELINSLSNKLMEEIIRLTNEKI